MPKLKPPVPQALRPPTRRPTRGPNGKPEGQQKKGAVGAGVHAADWIDERTQLSGGLRWVMFRKIPKGTNWFYTLGTASMFAFASQAITGIFLAMYYRPDAGGGAYESMRHINDNVFLGEFVHGMHRWGSSMMVILVCLHMARTFFFGAYKYPRELNWVIGVALLVLTFVMSFTGYLLPFDQRSFWATVVGNNINGTGPLVGPYLADFLMGGSEFNPSTLSRFYAIHMMVVPAIIAAMIGAHLWLVIRLGTTAPPWVKPEPLDPEALEEDA